jgi:hypothetical protein
MQMARCAYRRRDRRRAWRSSGGRISSRDSRKSRRAWRSSAPTTMCRRSASPRSRRAFRAGTTGTRARAVPWARAHSSACESSPSASFGSNQVDFGGTRSPASATAINCSMRVWCSANAIAARRSRTRCSRSITPRAPPTKSIRFSVRGSPTPKIVREPVLLEQAHVEAATGSARGANAGRILKRYQRPAPAARTGSPDAKSSRAPAKPTSRSKARSCRKAWTFASLADRPRAR